MLCFLPPHRLLLVTAVVSAVVIFGGLSASASDSPEDPYAAAFATATGKFEQLMIHACEGMPFHDAAKQAAVMGRLFADEASVTVAGNPPMVINNYVQAIKDGFYERFGGFAGIHFCKMSSSNHGAGGLKRHIAGLPKFADVETFSIFRDGKPCGFGTRRISFSTFNKEGKLTDFVEGFSHEPMKSLQGLLTNTCTVDNELDQTARAEKALMVSRVEAYHRSIAASGSEGAAEHLLPEVAAIFRAFHGSFEPHLQANYVAVESFRLASNQLGVVTQGFLHVTEGACKGNHFVDFILHYTFDSEGKISDGQVYGQMPEGMQPCLTPPPSPKEEL